MNRCFFLPASLALILSFLSPIESEAQWLSDVRLTANSADSYTSDNNAWCVASIGDNVHVVWYDDRDGNWEIYHKHSADGGLTWGTDTRLTTDDATSRYPSVALSNAAVHVVWSDGRDGFTEIYYKRSTDGGLTWGADTRLTNHPAYKYSPSIAVSGSVLYLVWADERNGNLDIYSKHSSDGGLTWSADTQVAIHPAYSAAPSVAISGSVRHVVWEDNRTGDFEIYYSYSPDSSGKPLTNSTSSSRHPSVAASGSVVHVSWWDNRDGNWEIYYKRSPDGGITWGSDVRLTDDAAWSESPSIAASDSAVHVVWWDSRDGSIEIYYKRSTDSGLTWSTDTRLTNSGADSKYSSVAVSDTVVHVVWRDDRDGNREIYYTRSPATSLTSIQEKGSEVPGVISLWQNYPNPFNPSTTIEFELPQNAFAVLKVYDFLGQEVGTLVEQDLPPGRYRVPWNAAQLPSGVYVYRLQAGQMSQSQKLVLLK